MKCPNCQSENVQNLDDNKILCLKCDTVFSIDEKDGAKVEKTDVLKTLDERVTNLEEKGAAPQKPAAAAEPGGSAEPEQEAQDDIPDDNLYPA
jgi:hypothetical protein